ncbi:MAG: DUF3391 domain-containing protein [Methylococcaceae bacterium]|nr:DUF3391 domain-containing protein [Methylococcaceae bacterium]
MSQENKSIDVVKTLIEDLEMGMYVSKLDIDWVDSSFLFQGFIIEEPEQLQQLREECEYVYIDLEKEEPVEERPKPKVTTEPKPKKATFGLDRLRHKADETPQFVKKERTHTNELNDILSHKVETNTIEPPKKTVSVANEMGVAKLTRTKTRAVVKDVLSGIKKGGEIDASLAEDAVHDCMDSMLRTPDAMMLNMNLKDKHMSSWQHSMNVAVLAIDLGRFLNLKDDELITLGLCGMFNDVGMTLISKKDLDEATDKRELIRSHTTLGYEKLSKLDGQMGTVVANVALSHHENLDGSGYPHGLQGDQISAYTRIITIVDIYDTLTSDKPNKKGLSHYETMVQMLKRVDAGHIDKTLFDSFNQCIGTYPVGSMVELNTGEIAVVMEENANHRLKPIVMIVIDAKQQECSNRKLINLSKPKIEGQDNTYFIKTIVSPEKYNIEI